MHGASCATVDAGAVRKSLAERRSRDQTEGGALVRSSEGAERTIVITGVTRGLGLALIEALARLGHRVSGCGRDQQALDLLRTRLSDHSLLAPISVSDDDAVREWAIATVDRFGPPDLLLNNAALINRNAPLWEIPACEFDPVIDVNLKGTANTIRHFVPSMIARGRGVIVNFSSGWGRSTSPQVAPYCTTKWGIEGLSRSLAQELPRGLASVALNPGVIHTAMLDSCFGGGASSYPKPDRWAERAVPFLLQLGAKDNGKSLTIPGA
ncbi:MAG: SDR family oxidoreductase [Candidatus Eisenbacteria bacterium]|nr:SDR family oxidoreductase [Candidatus Eisenbacteria bacterium]